MSGELSRYELMQIYNLVVMKLNPQHISWLKKERPKWKSIDFNNRQITFHTNGDLVFRRELNDERDYIQKADISFAIQDIIDAMNNKTEITYNVELTRPMMEALAIILDVQDKPHRNKFQILGAILALSSQPDLLASHHKTY